MAVCYCTCIKLFQCPLSKICVTYESFYSIILNLLPFCLLYPILHPMSPISQFILFLCTIRSDQISHSVMSDSLPPYGSQHARPLCPSPTPGVHSDSCPSSQWCHPAISSSAIPFSSCPQSLPASESFPMSQLFSWGGQSPGVSALASFLPKKSQGWSPWLGLFSESFQDYLIPTQTSSWHLLFSSTCFILFHTTFPLNTPWIWFTSLLIISLHSLEYKSQAFQDF